MSVVIMELNQYLNKINRPVSNDHPAGVRLDDDEQFDSIESEMLKVGSLAHTEVQWADVERQALALLEMRSKDLKLLTWLLQCLQHQCTLERFSCSLAVLNAFMQTWWESCFPAPGPKGKAIRGKFFDQIVQRTAKAAEGVAIDFGDADTCSVLLQSLTSLCRTARQYELSTELLEQLQIQLEQRFKAEPAPAMQEAPVLEPGDAGKSGVSEAAYQPMQLTPSLEVDTSSEKATRQTLLKVADFVAETPAGMALSLRLRRYATWFSVTSVPENANNKGETSLMPPSQDRLAEYRSQLSKAPSLALLKRIEQSLSLSPFWLEGHHLSAQLAIALGQPQWAQAIRDEVRAFVERLPELEAMSFKGGLEFVPAETRGWLEDGDDSAEGNSPAVSGSLDEILEMSRVEGLSVAFERLNEQLEQAREPRERFYLRLLGAELKEQHQLGALAEVEFEILRKQAEGTQLSEWEPGLLARLEQKVNQR